VFEHKAEPADAEFFEHRSISERTAISRRRIPSLKELCARGGDGEVKGVAAAYNRYQYGRDALTLCAAPIDAAAMRATSSRYASRADDRPCGAAGVFWELRVAFRSFRWADHS
jgi:hypothetical protein